MNAEHLKILAIPAKAGIHALMPRNNMLRTFARNVRDYSSGFLTQITQMICGFTQIFHEVVVSKSAVIREISVICVKENSRTETLCGAVPSLTLTDSLGSSKE